MQLSRLSLACKPPWRAPLSAPTRVRPRHSQAWLVSCCSPPISSRITGGSSGISSSGAGSSSYAGGAGSSGTNSSSSSGGALPRASGGWAAALPPLLRHGLQAVLVAVVSAAALFLAMLRPLPPSHPPFPAHIQPAALGVAAAMPGSCSRRRAPLWASISNSVPAASPCGPATSMQRAAAAASADPAFASAARKPTSGVASSASAPHFNTYQRQTANEVLALKLTLVVQQILAAHVVVKILAVFVVAAPIVYAGGFLYSLITGSSMQLGLLKIYSVVIRVPGAKVTEEKSLAAGVLMNVFFLVGVFSFAVLIGIVSEEIKAQLKGVRSGNYPVVTANHTLVLNWNRQTLPLLRKMALNTHGCQALGSELVVMAELSKDSMDTEIMKSREIMKSHLKVVTREGAPHCVRDLESVSAAGARTIIILHPDNTQDADTKKAATVLGLEVARGHPSSPTFPQKIILQRIPGDPGQMRLFALVNKSVRGREMGLVEVNGNRNIARLIAQSAVQPGVANIYSSIAQSSPGVPDFYLRACGADMAGKTYREARRSYPDAVVCGYVSGGSDGATHLNAFDDSKLQAADRLILLAHSDNLRPVLGQGAAAALPPPEALQERLRGAVLKSPCPKNIVVLGWRGHVADLANAIDDFAAPGSKVIFLSRWRPVDMPGHTAKVSFQYVEGNPFDHHACSQAGVGSCDSIIIGTMECSDGKAADARMLASLLVVQDIVSESTPDQDRPPHLVAAVHRGGTVRMARHILGDLGRDRLTAELLTPNELASGMLLQVAQEPGLAPALLELIDSMAGQELHLRQPQRYNLDVQLPTSFAEVVELARLRGETALGYVAGNGLLVLAPEAASEHLYCPDTRIVVMAPADGSDGRRGSPKPKPK